MESAVDVWIPQQTVTAAAEGRQNEGGTHRIHRIRTLATILAFIGNNRLCFIYVVYLLLKLRCLCCSAFAFFPEDEPLMYNDLQAVSKPLLNKVVC